MGLRPVEILRQCCLCDFSPFVCFSQIEPVVAIRPHEPSIHLEGFHRPADCCIHYTPRKIRCVIMKDYFITSSGCSQPGVIFLTKKGQRVCANPFDLGVQDCMRSLKLNLMTQT
ncbi:C-C motif chemokine 15-like [Hyaena hyaena]|uniref:C-C motif chemokine 15-like n=1 Tax=Hyaena hyaena TaxID=95912 RepID=UPI00192279BA|nr:C-C motif chemokine 15-like [Hyaena hyaena]